MRRETSRALSQINRGFKAALDQPIISLYHYNGCGFFDGGCLLLADALVEWSGGDIKLAAISRSRFHGQVDHWVGELNIAGERLFLDANGLQTEQGLLTYWREEEVMEPVAFIDQPVFDEAREIPRDRKFSAKIASEICNSLGLYTTWRAKIEHSLQPDLYLGK